MKGRYRGYNRGRIEANIGTGPIGVDVPFPDIVTSILLHRVYYTEQRLFLFRRRTDAKCILDAGLQEEISYIWSGDAQSYIGTGKKFWEP